MADRIDNKISVLFEGLLKRIAEERGGDLVDCNITELDFSGPIFELESIEGLNCISWKSLKALDVSNNSIDKLSPVLNKFSTLQTIIATNNLITKVDLSLPNLMELDVSRNYLKQIPDLSGAPKLERLLLGFNEISGGFHELTSLQNLLLLDLSNNRITFTPNDLRRFIDILKSLNKLDSLRIYNNPFCETLQQYEYYFISAITSLTSLNNELISKDQKINIQKTKLKPLEQVFKEAANNARNVLGNISAQQDADQMPKLDSLHYNMQSAKNSPTDCLEKFKLVARDVEKIVNRPAERFMIFKANTPEEQNAIRMHIDSFLQEAVMMIEDMPTMRTPVLRLLASLSEVEEGSFGQKCIMTLQDLFVSGPEIAKEIEEILKKIIIPKIKQAKVDNVAKDLLRGVIRLCKDHDITDMLSELIDTMAEWMRAEVTSEELRLVQGEIGEENKRELHTYMLELVAYAACNPNNAKAMVKKKIGAFTAKLIKVMERETEPSNILGKQEGLKDVIKRLKYILRIIENMSKNYVKSGQIFIKEEIHQKLLREVWDYLVFYKANGYSFSSGSGSAESVEIMYYKLLTAYLNTLAGLCNEGKCVEYINSTAKEIRDEILNVSIMPKTDPVLLRSIIELIHALLNSSYFTKSENCEIFKHYVNKLQKMLPFLPYLGGKKYKDICILAEKYAKGTIVGQEPIVISSLTNKYLHGLFIAIIKLIQFFSIKGNDEKQSEIKEICHSISKTLNANHREDLLFNCLEIPNDSVKLAVVQCLDKVPVDEIDIEETGHIVRILGSYKNLGVGRTEEVLSQIFLLLSKILENKDKGKDFRNKFGEMVITECLGILSRNQQRDLKDDNEENNEKNYLTVSGVNFLKKCSLHKSLYPFMENVRAEEKMRLILKAEEMYGTYDSIPVDIERTWIGSNIEPLLMCFSGTNHLFPYNEVCYRVIQQIANVLNKSPIEQTYEIIQSAEDQLSKLVQYTKSKVQTRIIDEDSAWPENPPADPMDSEHFERLERLEKQHQKFSQMKAITSMLTFLLGRSSMKCIEIDKELRAEFDPIFDKQSLLISMHSRIEEITKDYELQCKKAEEAETKQRGLEDLIEETVEIDPELLIRAMQEQDLNTEAHSYAMGMPGMDYEFSQYDTSKLKLRARILAAFLRCLIAAIERGPAITRLDAVLQIKDLKNLKSLTKLCATTGWKHSTLGAKYLRVIKHIIKLSPVSNFRPQEDVIIFETISIALSQILSLIRSKILNCEREPLTKEDHFLIKEIASVGASLCESVYTFQWSNQIEGIYKERTSLTIKSVQEQASAYILEQLISLEGVRDYIEIIFYDMTKRERMKADAYKMPEEEVVYMEKARKFIGDILATYIALSENCKYRVLEFCKIGIIFNEKVLNVTYLQDVMNRGNTMLFAIELSKHMKKSWLEFHMTQEQIPERTVNISWGDLWEKGSRSFVKVLIIITCRCVYLLNPCTSPPCPLCGEERFCPQPPTYRSHIEFVNIDRIMTFRFCEQIMGIEYKENDKDKAFIFISKTFSGSKGIADTLVSIKEEFTHSTMEDDLEIAKKMMHIEETGLLKSMENLLSRNEYGNSQLCVYASLNPETSFVSMFEGMKVFKRGTFCVVTDKEKVLALDVNFNNWVVDWEENEETPISGQEQNVFSVRNEFDLGKCSKSAIKDEEECKFTMEFDRTNNVFLFGDDYTLEIFQRHVMTKLYKVVGGNKVKSRISKETKGK